MGDHVAEVRIVVTQNPGRVAIQGLRARDQFPGKCPGLRGAGGLGVGPEDLRRLEPGHGFGRQGMNLPQQAAESRPGLGVPGIGGFLPRAHTHTHNI